MNIRKKRVYQWILAISLLATTFLFTAYMPIVEKNKMKAPVEGVEMPARMTETIGVLFQVDGEERGFELRIKENATSTEERSTENISHVPLEWAIYSRQGEVILKRADVTSNQVIDNSCSQGEMYYFIQLKPGRYKLMVNRNENSPFLNNTAVITLSNSVSYLKNVNSLVAGILLIVIDIFIGILLLTAK